jgi:hypothetical protein
MALAGMILIVTVTPTLCLILADENFPSIERGQEFVLWCKNDKNLEVLKLIDETHIIELFREFRQEILAQIMHLNKRPLICSMIGHFVLK